MTNLIMKEGFLSIPSSEMDLQSTLIGGQSFRWIQDQEWFTGVIKDIVFRLRRTNEDICYEAYSKNTYSSEQLTNVLNEYFQADVNLSDLLTLWRRADPNFKRLVLNDRSTRVLCIDFFECLISFICSSNNTVKRISKMVNTLCQRFGDEIGSISDNVYYTFPEADQLIGDNVESDLRMSKFGYRAPYIVNAARNILSKDSNWLQQMNSDEIKIELMKFKGIGSKIADCILLMSMKTHNAVPVDVHIGRVAIEEYKIFSLKKSKTLSKRQFEQIGKYFQKRWGKYAGWAQAMTTEIDSEINEGFKDLQMKLSRTQKELDLCDNIVLNKSFEIKQWKQLKEYIEKKPEPFDLYESVGRMFILEDKKRALDICDDAVKQSNVQIEQAKVHKTTVKTSYDDAKAKVKALLEKKNNKE